MEIGTGITLAGIAIAIGIYAGLALLAESLENRDK